MKTKLLIYILSKLILFFYKLKIKAFDSFNINSLNNLNPKNNLESPIKKVEIKKVLYLEDFFNIKNDDLESDELNFIEILDFSLPENESYLDDYQFYLKLIKNKNSCNDKEQDLFLLNLKEINLNNNKNANILRKKWLKKPLSRTEIVKLKNCNIRSYDLQIINNICKNIKTLDLSGNNNFKFSSVKNINFLKKVENLYLLNSKIKNEDLKFIGLNMSLKRLEFDLSNEIDLKNLNFKKSENSLEVLKIRSFEFSEDTNEFIKKFKNLKVLITKYEDCASKNYLNFIFDLHLKYLRILDISEQTITEDSFISIIKLENLEELNMNKIRLSFSSTEISSLKCPKLKKLHLSHCNLENNILKKFLLDNIDSLKYLDISYGSKVNNFFKFYFDIKNSKIDCINDFFDHTISKLVLEYLKAESTDLDNEQIEKILINLPIMYFKFGSIDDKKEYNLNMLETNTIVNFEKLPIDYVKKENADYDYVRNLTNLKELSLRYISVYNYNLIKNIFIFKNLESLSLEYVNFKGKISFIINSNNSVKKLFLNNNDVTYDLIVFFNKCFPNLQTLDLKNCSIELFGTRSDSEDIFQSLIYLNLNDCKGDYDDFYVFIQHCPKLMLFKIKKYYLKDALIDYLENNNWFVLEKNEECSFVTLTKYEALKEDDRIYNLRNDLNFEDNDEDSSGTSSF